MTSIIHFTPISGALDESPPCYLLNIDEFCFLLDCGCDENCNIKYVEDLKPHIPKIDAVLLSHPDIYHLGALPYLFGKCGLSCDVYATTPVYQMGQMFAYDLYQSRHNFEEFDLFTLDDIDLAFDRVIQVKYNQTVALKGKGQGIIVTPLPAGHMIGGTIWKIVKDGEEDIIYAVDINHKKDRHLNGCALEKLSRPSMLITNCNYYQPERKKKRDSAMFSCILETLRSNGNVLIGTDTAGRILEIAHMLDNFWRSEPGLLVYPIILLNNFSYNVIEFAKSLVEWMSDKLMRHFEGQRNNPFAFKHIQLCHNLDELTRFQEPLVILASQPDLECGYSRELFFTFATKPTNTIILTQRPSLDSLSHKLVETMAEPRPLLMNLVRKLRVPLADKELEEYLEKKREEELEKERNAQESLREKDEEESEEEYDDESYFDEEYSQVLSGNQKRSPAKQGDKMHNKYDLMMSSRWTDGRVKTGGFFKNAKKSYPMYPFIEKKLKWDEYGEIINPDDYVIFDMSKMFMEENMNLNGDDGMINGDNNQQDEEMGKSVAETIPTKCILSHTEVSMECKIEFIDLEGRSDAESLTKIIKMIRPRRLILVGASENNTKKFASHFNVEKPNPDSTSVFIPNLLELIDVTTERHIYQVKLKDALVSSLKFSQYKDGAQLAWVEGEIDMNIAESILPQQDEESTTVNKQDNNQEIKDNINNTNDQNKNRESIPILKQLPQSDISPHQTIFVNELKLSDFKQILMKHGIKAEFVRGVLVCNGQVEVKRTECGRIHLEGTVSDEYFKVRQLLFNQYAIL